MARRYNHANVLVMSLRLTSETVGTEILTAFLGSPDGDDAFEGYRKDLDDAERKVAGEIDPGVRAMVVAVAVLVLVGPPGYYRRFGFRHDGGLRIEGVPPEYVLCLPLREETPRGAVTHHPAFLADA